MCNYLPVLLFVVWLSKPCGKESSKSLVVLGFGITAVPAIVPVVCIVLAYIALPMFALFVVELFTVGTVTPIKLICVCGWLGGLDIATLLKADVKSANSSLLSFVLTAGLLNALAKSPKSKFAFWGWVKDWVFALGLKSSSSNLLLSLCDSKISFNISFLVFCLFVGDDKLLLCCICILFCKLKKLKCNYIIIETLLFAEQKMIERENW